MTYVQWDQLMNVYDALVQLVKFYMIISCWFFNEL